MWYGKNDNNSNLPPGVTPGMIPGNRPEDEENELDWIKFHNNMDDLALHVPIDTKELFEYILDKYRKDFPKNISDFKVWQKRPKGSCK